MYGTKKVHPGKSLQEGIRFLNNRLFVVESSCAAPECRTKDTCVAMAQRLELSKPQVGAGLAAGFRWSRSFWLAYCRGALVSAQSQSDVLDSILIALAILAHLQMMRRRRHLW